jgi:lanosterol synthase
MVANSTGREGSALKSRKRAADSESEPLLKQGQPFPKQPRISSQLDTTRWRLKDDDSRHTWHYLENDDDAKEWPQSYAEKWYLNLPMVRSLPDPLSIATNMLDTGSP